MRLPIQKRARILELNRLRDEERFLEQSKLTKVLETRSG
jgi:hypothetical protein